MKKALGKEQWCPQERCQTGGCISLTTMAGLDPVRTLQTWAWSLQQCPLQPPGLHQEA